jgi:hypothetical protein
MGKPQGHAMEIAPSPFEGQTQSQWKVRDCHGRVSNIFSSRSERDDFLF